MTVTLLNLYNMTASQPWSMFDNDAEDTEDFNPALLSAINKALVEIWCSYPFEFRLRNKIVYTQNFINKYNLPDGAILQKSTTRGDRYAVTIGRKYLELIETPELLDCSVGKPNSFFIKNNSMGFYPLPDDMYSVHISYLTFAVGTDIDDKPIYALREANDRLCVPEKYEQVFLNALIAKSMMYALTSPSDENYAGYALQFDKAYKLLIKMVGGRKKSRKIVF